MCINLPDSIIIINIIINIIITFDFYFPFAVLTGVACVPHNPSSKYRCHSLQFHSPGDQLSNLEVALETDSRESEPHNGHKHKNTNTYQFPCD